MIRTELPSDGTGIKGLKQFSFSNHNHGNRLYPTHRFPLDYQRDLPKVNDQTFEDCIKDRLAQNQEVNILDVGCGEGIMLAILGIDHPHLEVYGLSAYDYRSRLSDPWKPLIGKVDYRVGDAHELLSLFPDVKFDLIVSHYAHEYMLDPVSVLEQEFQLLKEGGMIFLDKFYPTLTIDQKCSLETYMERQGIQFDLRRFAPMDPKWDPVLHSLVVQKGLTPTLSLPFKPTGVIYYNTTDVVQEVRFEYSMNVR